MKILRSNILVLVFSLCFLTLYSQDKPRLALPVGHTSSVYKAKFSPDSKLIATSSFDRTVKVWHAETGTLMHDLVWNNEDLELDQFSPNGKLLLTSSRNIVNIWDLTSGEAIHNFECQECYIIHAQFSPDGKHFLISDKTVKLRDALSGEIISNFDYPDYEYGVSRTQFSSDGKLIAIPSPFFSVQIWEAMTGKLLLNISGHNDIITSVQFSPDGKKIITSSNDRTVKIWDATTGKQLQILQDSYDDEYYSAQFSPDGKWILTISWKNRIAKIWDAKTGEQIHNFNNKIRNDFICFSPDGSMILSVPQDNIAKIWETSSGRLLQVLQGHTDEIHYAQFSQDGIFVVTASADKTAKIWEASTGRPLRNLQGRADFIISAHFSNDGEKIITESFDNTIKVWDLSTAKLLQNFEEFNYLMGSSQFSPDGEWIATASADSVARIFETVTGKLLHELIGHTSVRNNMRIYTDMGTYKDTTVLSSNINSSHFSPDGKKIVTASSDKTAIVWDAINAKLLYKLRGHTGSVKSAEFSPDAKWILTTSYNNEIKIWDASTGIEIQDIEEDSYYDIHTTQFSPDENRLLTASAANAKIWDISTGMELIKLSGYPNGFVSAQFSPDGKLIVTATGEKTALIWNANTGELLHKLQGHTNELSSGLFSPDGKWVITCSADGTAIIWNATDGSRHCDLKGHKSEVFSAQFSPDGKYIITLSRDHILKIWDGNTFEELVDLIALKSSEYMFKTPDAYYSATKNSAKYIGYIINNKPYSFEQFDLKFNRPDLVLKQLKHTDNHLIDTYKKAYLKRLNKTGFKEENLGENFHLPEAEITNHKSLPVTNQKTISFEIVFKDSKYKLDRYNIWINDVALFGMKGKSIKELQIDSLKVIETIQLSEGRNKIQASCLNTKGAESYKETVEVTYIPDSTINPQLHLIALSVSKYQQDNMNIQYAVKDGRDLVNQYLQDKTKWSEIIVDTLYNQDAQRENILALKRKLLQTGVDDQVILFVSGHGLLDDNFDFYFATYDIDFNNPSEKGISYDELEWLLDSIPARKKLFLMDACHSGEVDKEEIIAYNAEKVDTLKSGVKRYTYKAGILQDEETYSLGLQNSFELMQELFTNLNRGSGAVVISAAAGDSYAMESDEWHNGVFTYSILNGLKSGKADINNDGEVSVSELRDYVGKSVQDLTNGLQKPTMRQENVEFDFRIW
ncbi:caspase family protein [Bacteroidota bacterium]